MLSSLSFPLPSTYSSFLPILIDQLIASLLASILPTISPTDAVPLMDIWSGFHPPIPLLNSSDNSLLEFQILTQNFQSMISPPADPTVNQGNLGNQSGRTDPWRSFFILDNTVPDWNAGNPLLQWQYRPRLPLTVSFSLSLFHSPDGFHLVWRLPG